MREVSFRIVCLLPVLSGCYEVLVRRDYVIQLGYTRSYSETHGNVKESLLPRWHTTPEIRHI